MRQISYIQVSQDIQAPHGARLFSILERLLPVRFGTGGLDSTVPIGIIIGQDAANTASVHSLSIPITTPPPHEIHVIETEIKFADDPDVPFPFRGRKLSTKLGMNNPGLALRVHEKVLASSAWGPVWALSESGPTKHFRSALPLPDISPGRNFHDAFNGEYFLEMLVLLQFIRAIGTDALYQLPPLRAGFIIDDPNLHWPHYGYVDYRQLAHSARRGNYHAAFASIPLDTWFTHTGTVGLFLDNPQWLSLLIHGNNHAKRELALDYAEPARRALLRQAVQRMERLERKTGLEISRVMVPPHGACSSAMLAELPGCGFESACVSAGSLGLNNPGQPWTETLGFFPSEIINGCPVLPRWGLGGKVENTLLVAAYLGQPMILRGHHQDLRQGLEILDGFADFINGLGNVLWSDMGGLSRRNYLWRMEGTLCRLRPLGIATDFVPPDGATALVVESPTTLGGDTRWTVANDGSTAILLSGEPFPLPEQDGRGLSIIRAVPPVPAGADLGKPSAKLVLRRLLTEARDRVSALR